MNIQSNDFTKSFLFLVIAVLMVFFLSSCGTLESTNTAEPTGSPRMMKTETPVPATITSEPESEEDRGVFILPSSTPAPTATPGMITELVSQFAQTRGLDRHTFLGISVADWLNLAISIVMALLVGFFLSRLVYFALVKATAKTETRYDDDFIKAVRHLITVIFIVVGIQIGTLRLPFLDVILKQWFNQLYSAIYVIVVTIILWHLLDALVEWYKNDVEPKRDARQVDTLLILLHRVARVMLITVSALVLLSLNNINVNALIAALGVGGLAISLAAQDTLSNVISGLMIMLDQPFRVGDRIEIGGLGTWGDVVDIGLRTTRIRTLDNRLVIVPNNRISTDQIVNYTFPDPRYRIQIEIGIGYGQDIEKIRKIIVETVSQVEGVLPDKPVDALYVEMSPSAMTFRVRWWIQSYVDTRRMYDRVNTALQESLDKAGIAMPFDTYDIRIVNVSDKAPPIDQDEG